MKPKIYLSGDHAGFKLKEKIKPWLEGKGHKIIDMGPLEYKPKDDYPCYTIPMAKKVLKDKNSLGIIIAGSGQGEAIATNKLKGIRTALYHGGSTRIVKTGRAHDNANILAFGSRFVTEAEAKKAINIFLNTKFEGGRHSRRLREVERLTR